MSTPKKLLKLEQPAEEEVDGYVHFVSPVKKSNKNNTPYFQCVLQTAKDVFDDMVSFSPEKHAIFAQACEKKTPVHLRGVVKSLSYRSTSGTSILCRRTTEIKSSDCIDFHHRVPSSHPLDKKSHNIDLADMPNEVTGNRVNVTAKVMSLHPKRHVSTKIGESDVQDIIIADATGSTKLSLWAEKMELVVNGNTYRMKCLSVKDYLQEKFLSTCADTTFERTDDLDDVQEDEDFKPFEVIGTPIVIKMNTTKACNQCKARMDLNPEEMQRMSIKCKTCGMRQLIRSIKSNSNAKLKLDSNPSMFEISNSLLTAFSETHDIHDDDELEEFFLQHKIRITLPSHTSCLASTLATAD